MRSEDCRCNALSAVPCAYLPLLPLHVCRCRSLTMTTPRVCRMSDLA